jgi:hypothetical protein
VPEVFEGVAMPLVFSRDDVVMRVDGDVLEIFRPGAFSHRIMLTWLEVQVQPSIRGRLIVRIMSARGDRPLYEVMRKAKATVGSGVEMVISTDEEPVYRQFFTEVARLCGRPVVP